MEYLKGRGAQINPANPFDRFIYDENPGAGKDEDAVIRTEYIEVYPKNILNKVKSPDIPSDYSLNPYQGCEHGCVYCYARNTHPYWGYSAGLEFEQKILVKKSAPKLLEDTLKKKSWKASPVMLSGNTDCYQPIEKKLEITRQILEVFWKYRHPVGIITKNSLVLRDIDLLEKLASENLVQVAISVTTLNDEFRRFLEPRTASIPKRLEAIERLSQRNIPVFVMLAPMIPGLNDHEMLELAKTVREYGARGIGYTMVRLNGDVGAIFTDWMEKNMPDRAAKVLNKIKSCHGGELHDHRFKTRMRGEGQIAEMINQQFKLAKKRFFSEQKMPAYNLSLHEQAKTPQLKLF